MVDPLHLFRFLLQFHNQLQRLLAHWWTQKPSVFGLLRTEHILWSVIATKTVYDIVCIIFSDILMLYKRTKCITLHRDKGMFQPVTMTTPHVHAQNWAQYLTIQSTHTHSIQHVRIFGQTELLQSISEKLALRYIGLQHDCPVYEQGYTDKEN